MSVRYIKSKHVFLAVFGLLTLFFFYVFFCIARTNWATGANAGTTIVGDFRIVGRYTGTLPVGTVSSFGSK